MIYLHGYNIVKMIVNEIVNNKQQEHIYLIKNVQVNKQMNKFQY